MTHRPPISVVIPTLNRADFVREAITSLQAGREQDYEALVMDQSDDDATERLITELGDPRNRYIRVPRKGVAPARNLGSALAKAPLVAFIDDDCVAREDWLQRILALFARHASLQFIFGELRAPGERPDGAYPEFLPGEIPPRERRKRTVAMIAAGANMSARKDFLRRIGGFDEVLGPDVPDPKGDDASISYKVWRSGERWLATPDVSVVHVNGFRTHPVLRVLYREYAHGVGITYGRLVRRGDIRALETFMAEQARLLWVPLRHALTGHPPRGLRPWWAHAHGFARGLRLDPQLGHIDGAAFRRIEETGTL